MMVPPLQASSLYNTNRIARITLESLEGIIGKNGLIAVFRLAGVPQLIEAYPPDNLNREFDFACTSAIFQALEEVYGPRGGRGLAMRAGRMSFTGALASYGDMAGVTNDAFQQLSLQMKVKIGLVAMARVFSQTSDQTSSVHETAETYIYRIHRCPSCWGRVGLDKPICFAPAGLLMGGLKWASGGREFKVEETCCMAMGAESCDFAIEKEPIS
jgi:hypothetical protein